MPIAAIPSPTQSVWHLGGIPIRAYALCIVLGIIAAAIVTEIRMRQRGVPKGMVLDLVVWAVPFGIVGARIYHVLTSPDDYFGADGQLLNVFKIWQGGIGIWGAVAGGALGAFFACRNLGLPLRLVAGAIAPALPLAQAIGRWGNYFNNELFGSETSLPWGLKVYEWNILAGQAITDTGDGSPIIRGVFHPTFLYESLWDLGVAVLVWLLDRRYRFGRGRAFAVYVMAYCVGRFWIEALRTDPAQHILGLRLNNWTALLVFLGALLYFLLVKGPQERLVIDSDGKLILVDAESPATPLVDAPVDTAMGAPQGAPVDLTKATDAVGSPPAVPPGDGDPAAGLGATDGRSTTPSTPTN
ncbi:MAG: prolipoprotein diacylglyceryl transferase [Dactylosporangium sp.]|nr:prolipoprotein diacylglyceryl transferase [Dactylosporangium sp.]NNJ59469.1 prolipoprotein diacylglyceryl transferase [Dactylosporangium sp.]